MKRIFTLACMLVSIMSCFALTIEDGKVYTIANRNDNNLYVKDNGNNVIAMGAKDDNSLWQFIPTGNANCYYVKNVATGRYAQECATTTEVNVTMGDTPVEYSVVACDGEGIDCFGLTSTNESVTNFTAGCIGWNWKGDNTVQTFAAVAGTNHRSFWKITEIDLVGNIDLTYMVKNNDFELTDGMIEDGTNFRGVPTNWHAWGMRGGEEYTQEPGVNNTTLLPKASYGANGGCGSSLHGTKSYWLNCTPMPDDLKLYQEVALPAGNYRVTCLLSAMTAEADALTNLRLFAGDNASYFGTEDKYDVNLGNETNKTFMGYNVIMDGSDPKMQTMVLEFTLDDATTIELGIRTSNMQKDGTRSTGNQGRFRCDYFTLTKVDAFVQHEHDYSHNGICTCEGPAKFEEPAKDGDYYLVDNAGKLEWISATVAAGNLVTNVKLTADIDFENIENLHSPIGPNTGNKYNGTFDGQGHRIMNMIINHPENDNIGFFGFLRGNSAHTVIRNLIMDSSCSITARNRAGGIAGSCQNSGTSITIENCVNEASVTVSGQDAAGFVGGHHDGGSPKWIIRNCINTGTITTSHEDGYVGAFFCWSGVNEESTFENLINIGHIGTHHGGNIGRLAGAQRNIVDLSDSEDKTQGVVESLTSEAIANGALAYYINKVAGEDVFFQTIGTDAYPVPFTTSEAVYGFDVTDAGYATYAVKANVNFDDLGVDAYKVATVEDSYVTLTQVTEAVADDVVIIKADEASYCFNAAASATTVGENKLVASATDIEADGTQYILAKNEEDKVGFHKAEAGSTIEAGKGYIVAPASAKMFLVFADAETTAIEGVIVEKLDGTREVYNLQGQKLSGAQRGINIVNGRKILF